MHCLESEREKMNCQDKREKIDSIYSLSIYDSTQKIQKKIHTYVYINHVLATSLVV